MASAFKIFSVLMNTAQPEIFVQETDYARAVSRLGEQYFETSRPNIDITNENFLASANMYGVVVKRHLGYFSEKAASIQNIRQAVGKRVPQSTALEMTLAPPPIRTLEAERLRAMIVNSPDSAGTSTDVELAPQEESIDTPQSIWGHLANAATVEITASNISQRASELGQAFFGQQKAAAEAKVQAIRNGMRKKAQSHTTAEISVPPTRSPDEIHATASVDAVPTIYPDQRDSSSAFAEHAVTHAHDSISAVA